MIKIKNRTLMNVLTLMLVCALYICDLMPYGSLIIAALTLLILGFYVILHRTHIRLKWSSLIGYMIVFAFYCALSALWSVEKSYAIQQCVTIVELAICAYVLYLNYSEYNSSLSLWKIIYGASIIISAYTIVIEGFSNILTAVISGNRVNLSFTNINSVALLATYGILIAIYFMLFEGKKKYIFSLPLQLLIIFASQTRKGFIALALGVLLLVYFRNKSMTIPKKLLVLVASGIGVIVAYKLISSIELFEPIIYRLEMAVNAFTGEGYVDNSTRQRAEMNAIGYGQFIRTPIHGMGMGNPRVLLEGMWGNNYPYLHNNYLELLAGGGIIGTLLYYIMYIHVIVKAATCRGIKWKPKYIIWMVVLITLVMDYFMVTYYSKMTYVYLMIMYVGCREMVGFKKTSSVERICSKSKV